MKHLLFLIISFAVLSGVCAAQGNGKAGSGKQFESFLDKFEPTSFPLELGINFGTVSDEYIPDKVVNKYLLSSKKKDSTTDYKYGWKIQVNDSLIVLVPVKFYWVVPASEGMDITEYELYIFNMKNGKKISSQSLVQFSDIRCGFFKITKEKKILITQYILYSDEIDINADIQKGSIVNKEYEIDNNSNINLIESKEIKNKHFKYNGQSDCEIPID